MAFWLIGVYSVNYQKKRWEYPIYLRIPTSTTPMGSSITVVSVLNMTQTLQVLPFSTGVVPKQKSQKYEDCETPKVHQGSPGG